MNEDQVDFRSFECDQVPITGVRRVGGEMRQLPAAFTAPVVGPAGFGQFSGDRLRLSRFVDAETGRLMARFVTDMLAEVLPPERVTETTLVEFRRPATWWDHFKETYRDRWWLRRLVRRRPVQVEVEQRAVRVTVDLQRYRVYPRADVSPPAEFGAPVRWSSWAARGEEVL